MYTYIPIYIYKKLEKLFLSEGFDNLEKFLNQ